LRIKLKGGESKVKKIIASLAIIALVGLMSAGATVSYFSDTATIEGNTFSTGILEIRVNGQPTVAGAVFAPTVPGEYYTSPTYGLQNYGAPWFGGPSNLTAESLILNVANANDYGSGLWQEVMVEIEIGRTSGAEWHQVYEGLLKDLTDLDLFSAGYWSELIPGSTHDMRYTVWLPETDNNQNNFMGKTLVWDFVVEGRTN
jgi:predicted ribosomally synthesized peptide with SipW-like signal peptide